MRTLIYIGLGIVALPIVWNLGIWLVDSLRSLAVTLVSSVISIGRSIVSYVRHGSSGSSPDNLLRRLTTPVRKFREFLRETAPRQWGSVLTGALWAVLAAVLMMLGWRYIPLPSWIISVTLFILLIVWLGRVESRMFHANNNGWTWLGAWIVMSLVAVGSIDWSSWPKLWLIAGMAALLYFGVEEALGSSRHRQELGDDRTPLISMTLGEGLSWAIVWALSLSIWPRLVIPKVKLNFWTRATPIWVWGIMAVLGLYAIARFLETDNSKHTKWTIRIVPVIGMWIGGVASAWGFGDTIGMLFLTAVAFWKISNWILEIYPRPEGATETEPTTT